MVTSLGSLVRNLYDRLPTPVKVGLAVPGALLAFNATQAADHYLNRVMIEVRSPDATVEQYVAEGGMQPEFSVPENGRLKVGWDAAEGMPRGHRINYRIIHPGSDGEFDRPDDPEFDDHVFPPLDDLTAFTQNSTFELSDGRDGNGDPVFTDGEPIRISVRRELDAKEGERFTRKIFESVNYDGRVTDATSQFPAAKREYEDLDEERFTGVETDGDGTGETPDPVKERVERKRSTSLLPKHQVRVSFGNTDESLDFSMSGECGYIVERDGSGKFAEIRYTSRGKQLWEVSLASISVDYGSVDEDSTPFRVEATIPVWGEHTSLALSGKYARGRNDHEEFDTFFYSTSTDVKEVGLDLAYSREGGENRFRGNYVTIGPRLRHNDTDDNDGITELEHTKTFGGLRLDIGAHVNSAYLRITGNAMTLLDESITKLDVESDGQRYDVTAMLDHPIRIRGFEKTELRIGAGVGFESWSVDRTVANEKFTVDESESFSNMRYFLTITGGF